MTPADIVERLRGARRDGMWTEKTLVDPALIDEAADTIEKHRAAIEPTDANVERLAKVLMYESDLDPAVFIGMHGQLGHFGDTARAILAALNERTTQ